MGGLPALRSYASTLRNAQRAVQVVIVRVRAAAADGSVRGARELRDALTLALAAAPVASAGPLVPDGQPPPLLLGNLGAHAFGHLCLLYTSPSPRD